MQQKKLEEFTESRKTYIENQIMFFQINFIENENLNFTKFFPCIEVPHQALLSWFTLYDNFDNNSPNISSKFQRKFHSRFSTYFFDVIYMAESMVG
jgi:hypothetical protein